MPSSNAQAETHIQKFDYDVIICGGGLAGLIAALHFAHHGFRTLCFDQQKSDSILKAKSDGRTTAISYGSRQLLDLAGLWSGLNDRACPIRDIHIRDGATPTLLKFLSDDVGGKSFGWIVDNQDLRQHLVESARKAKNLDYKDGVIADNFSFESDQVSVQLKGHKKAVTTALLIGADGRMSGVRQALDISVKQWSYDQSAIVFIAHHSQAHDNIAVEHFRKEGPFAVLPMLDDADGSHRSSIVWSQHKGSDVMSYDDDTFTAAVQARFGEYFGTVTRTGKRYLYPLSYMHADRYTDTRTCLIAEAAHVMHPIAGQGLNMSLRDVAAIVELAVDARAIGIDIGSVEILDKYEAWRKNDNRMMGYATDGLNRLFSNNLPPVRLLRNVGLELVKHTPFAKQFFMRQAMGHMGNLPRLIKGEALK